MLARRPGSTLPMTAVCVISLFAFTALAVDLGMVMVARTECQNAADAGALAGARQLNTVDAATNNQPAALIAGGDTVAQNPYLNTQFQDQGGSIATATAWGTTAGRSLASGQGTGAVPKSIGTGGKVSNMKIGVFRYNPDPAVQRFDVQFPATRNANEAWSAVRVDTVGVQPAFFSRVFGMAGLQTQARAVAIHRPRDIALVLDMSGSMRYGTIWNWNREIYTALDGSDGGGTMSPDPLYPQFGHYARYDAYNTGSSGTSPVRPDSDWKNNVAADRPHPFYQVAAAPIPGSSEVIAPNNYSVETGGGPAAVRDFLTGTPAAGATPTASMQRGFHQWDPPGFAPVFGGPNSQVAATGDFSGWSPAAPMPAPPAFGKQNESGTRMGDRFPRKRGSTNTAASWAVDDPAGAAVTAAEFLGWNRTSTTTYNAANAAWPVADGSTGKSWTPATNPTGTTNNGARGYARNATAGTYAATDSSSLPDRFTGAGGTPLPLANMIANLAGLGSATVAALTTGLPAGLSYTTSIPAVAPTLPLQVGAYGNALQPLAPRTWDNFRDGTWERNGYDLDVADYTANRPADWDPRWEWNLGADRTRPVEAGKPAWWGRYDDFPRPGKNDFDLATKLPDPRDNLNNQPYNPKLTDAMRPDQTAATSGWKIDPASLANPYGSTVTVPAPAGTPSWRPKLKPAAERFKGYTVAPGYYGKTFAIWPPDPRTPVGEPGQANYQPGDWRLRYFKWTPPIRPTYNATPPSGYSTSSTWTQTGGDAYDQFRDGTYTYTYTPPKTGGGNNNGGTSTGTTSTGTSTGSTGTAPPPPPPPPRRHDRDRPLTAAEVVRLRNKAAGTEFVTAMLQTAPAGTTPPAGEYATPSRFGNLNRTLFADGREHNYWNDKPMPISTEQTNMNDRWSFEINYEAILRWIKAPPPHPQTLPSSLRAGRLVYYKTIPNDVNYGTGSADDIADKYFWREYIEFVMGQWQGDYRRDQRHLAGYEYVGWPELGGVKVDPRVNMAWHALGDVYQNGFGSNWQPVDGWNGGYDANPLYGRDRLFDRLDAANGWKYDPATPLNAPTNTQLPRDLRPYMGYMDNPPRPRQHFWFGPLSMMAFLANLHDGSNMWPGTSSEAQSWQLKAAVDSALDDVQKNHPNDAVGLAYFSSKLDTNWNVTSGYRAVAAPLGQDFKRIKNTLYYPLQMVQNGDVNDSTKEYRPYSNGGQLGYNGKTRVPNSQDGTDPNTGLALAYNILTPSANAALSRTPDQRGRKGAAKIVIFETDGAPRAALNLQFNAAGTDSYYTVQNTGVQTSSYFQTARDEAIKVVQQIVKPVNTAAGGDSGFSTPNTPARVYAVGFGDLFQFTGTPSSTQAQALDFLRDVQIAGNTLPASAAATPGYLALPPDHIVGDARYTDRMNKLRTAFERILQSGVQVTLIE